MDDQHKISAIVWYQKSYKLSSFRCKKCRCALKAFFVDSEVVMACPVMTCTYAIHIPGYVLDMYEAKVEEE